MAKKETAPLQKEVTIPIKWNVPDTMISRYASNMLVQILENEFKLTFFEMKPEIRTTADAPSPTEVRADCVASIIINPKKIPSFIKALQTQYDIFKEREQKVEKAD